MKQFTFTIEDKNGIHARPAGAMVACAKKFASNVRIATSEKEADGKRLLSIMGLGATQGVAITVTIEGEDEDAACVALEACCREMLGVSHG